MPAARRHVPPLALGWTAFGATLALLIAFEHGATPGVATWVALRMIVTGAALAAVAYGAIARVPWPHPMRFGFVARHVLYALAYTVAWLLLNSLLESVATSVRRGALVFGIAGGSNPVSSLVLGAWLYVMIAAATYAARAAERSARLEATAARAQLAALRAQLQPHFLFNALHTVVQLIPIDPGRAVQAAETLADALRHALADNRDVTTLHDEWAFVERYLELERLRYGDRLRLETTIEPTALSMLVPTFLVQTLVENAIRHGLAASVAPVTIRVELRARREVVDVCVADDGPGADPEHVRAAAGTGLRRLQRQLVALGGPDVRCVIDTAQGSGFRVSVSIPQAALERHAETQASGTAPAEARGDD